MGQFHALAAFLLGKEAVLHEWDAEPVWTQWQKQTSLHSKGFWPWCITFRITGFLDVIQPPIFLRTTDHSVSETDAVSETLCSVVFGKLDNG
jgi:hypothetical protein